MNDVDSADLLQGVAAIGAFLKMTPRRVHHLIDTADLPAFKIGGRVCARRAGLMAWIEKQEQAAGAPKGEGNE